jgi:hypothetical protein
MNNIKIKNLNKAIYISLYLSLILGFYLNEDLAGGAILDLNVHIPLLNSFKENYLYNFLNFKDFETDHSPFYWSFINFINLPFYDTEFTFNKHFVFGNNPIEQYQKEYNALRLIYLHICLLVPVIFYKCLKIKYKDCDQNILVIISSLLLISPYFRAYAIWLGETNLALLFLLGAFYFFLRLEGEKKIKNKYLFIFLNVLFFALAAYSRPIYSLISLYFFFKIFEKFKFGRELYIFIFSSIILSFPALYYFFILEQYPFILMSNFFYNPTIDLYSTNILIISTIFLFYSIPFLIINKNIFFKQQYNFDKINISLTILTSFLTLFLIHYFNYHVVNGGGFFYILSNKILNNNVLFYVISFFSILLLLKIIFECKINDILLIILLICFDPDLFVYHKTYDPLIFVVFLLLFENKLFSNMKKTNQKVFISNLSIFYIGVFFMYFAVRVYSKY